MTFASQIRKVSPISVTIDWDKSTARINFDAKPSVETRSSLKAQGFRFSDGAWTGPMSGFVSLKDSAMNDAAVRVLLPMAWYKDLEARGMIETAGEVKATQVWSEKFGWSGSLLAQGVDHVDYKWVCYKADEAEAVVEAAIHLKGVPAREIDSVSQYNVIAR